MTHWIAKLLFRLDPAGAGGAVMEEKLLLLRAPAAGDAWEMARNFGTDEEEEFIRNGSLIRWKFEGILQLEALPEAGIVEIDSRETSVSDLDNTLLYAQHRIENTRREINCGPIEKILN